MSYAAKDDSIHDAEPIEFYEFIAQHKTWRFTSYHKPFQAATQSEGAQWYTPLPIIRTTIEISSIIDAPTTMDFQIPHDHEIARTFCYPDKSPKELVVIVRSYHEGDDPTIDFKVEWYGHIAGNSAAGKWGIIKTASIIRTELGGFLSSVYYQKSCNHVLFDARCKAVEADFTEVASVVKIQKQIITVNNMVFSADELINGVMENVRTGERQGIISNNLNIIRIGYPFFDIVVGDDVKLIRGCDHQRLGDCKDVFNNVDNYGGFDFIPEINPFEKLTYASVTETEIGAKGALEWRFNVPKYSSKTTRGGGGGTSTVQGPYRLKGAPVPANQRQSTFETSVSESSGNIPAAFLGQPVSAVLGRKRVANHNLIWTGNLRPLTETITSVKEWKEEIPGDGGFVEVITHTETVTTVSTVGYLIDMMLGICLGDDVHLKGIYVDGTSVWSGDVGPARTEITIPEGESFLSGLKVYFSGGEYDQAPDPLIDVDDFPGHVGIATALIKDVRADVTMGQISFEVVRIPNPLSLATGINRTEDDLNGVSALVEVMTNEWGYGGLSLDYIDTATFSNMAVIAEDEGNIMSVKIDSESGVNAVISAMQDQLSCIVFEHPELGQITGKMIRESDINYASMPRYNLTNIKELRSYEKGGWRDTLEQARGLFTERDAEYNEVPVFVQNAANISRSGRGKKTANYTYPFVPNKSLALDLLSRDMGRIAAPGYNFGLVTSRKAASELPGNIISVTYPDFDMLNIPMEVLTVRKQPIDSREVLLVLRQIRFPDTGALFGPGGGIYNPGFNVDPETPLAASILSAPYYMVRSANGITGQETNPLVYPIILPRPANDFQASFNAYVNNIPAASGPARTVQGSPYPTYCQLNGAIGQYDGFATGEIASIVVDNVVNANNLIDIAESGVRAGRLLMFIGNEILSFEDATNNGDGSWTLTGVHRALLDTVFNAHADNANVYIVGSNYALVSSNGFSVPPGYTPEWSIVSNGVTKQGQIADALITSSWVPDAVRTLAPPRPHDTKVNGTARSSTPVAITEGASVTVTWKTRTRLAQAVTLMADAAETGEVNGSETQKHHVMFRTSGGSVFEIGNVSGYAANTATFTMPDVPDGSGSIYVEARMVLSGFSYTSIYQDRVPVTVSPAPP